MGLGNSHMFVLAKCAGTQSVNIYVEKDKEIGFFLYFFCCFWNYDVLRTTFTCIILASTNVCIFYLAFWLTSQTDTNANRHSHQSASGICANGEQKTERKRERRILKERANIRNRQRKRVRSEKTKRNRRRRRKRSPE